tara:strand:+ start:1640 stop:2290 length:651 start_codon:yes stop_codon:yes gene_type:complete
MIPKLKDLLKINQIKYSDKVDAKHQKKIDMQTELIADEMRIPHTPPPENSSKKTGDELKWLINYNGGVINKDFVKKGDNVIKVFEDYCKDNDLKFDKTYYKQIIKESSKTILSLKYYYNRPRPHQLSEYYDMDEFEHFEISSMKTPAYPSGHSTQGHLMAELLGREHPNHYDTFKGLADMISASRLMARSHYPSDCKFGEEVAQHLLGKVMQKKYD